MFDPDEIAARQVGHARQMTERLNALAERVFVQAEAATEPQVLQAAALTVEKLYRGVRLCMGFEARVVREHRQVLRETEAEAAKVRAAVRAQGIQDLTNAVCATFVTEYETERDACEAAGEDSDDALRELCDHLRNVEDAVTNAEPHLDPTGDIKAQVKSLRESALMMGRVKALNLPPPPEPPELARPRPGPLPVGRWRGSG